MLFVYFFEMDLFGRFLLQTQFPVGQVATARYFNPHWWNQGHSIKSTQLVQKGSLLLLAVTASLMLAFRRHACWRRCGNGRWKTASWCKPERTCITRNRRAWPAPLPPARRSPALRSWRALSTEEAANRRLPEVHCNRLALTGCRYAIRTLYDRRFADLAATLPQPASLPLSELLPAPATQEFGSWTAGPQDLTA